MSQRNVNLIETIPVLAIIMLWVVSCQSAQIPLAREYRGTIYYVDGEGVWKLKLPSRETIHLSGQRTLFPWSLIISPNQQWLAYTDSEIDNAGREWMSLWVISTQGGDPFRVSSNISIPHGSWLGSNQLLYRDDQSAWVFDPVSRKRQNAAGWMPNDGCFAWVNPTGKNEFLESCPPVERGRGFLRITDFDKTHPITLTEPFGVNDSVQWSSDGENVLFMDGPLDYEKLFIWSRSDRRMRQIIGDASQRDFTFGDISWSPDGQWIIFTDNGKDLFVIKASTGEVKSFEGFVSAIGTRASWSPDSDAIVISSNRIGMLRMNDPDFQWDLFVIGIPNGDILRVTSRSDHSRRYVWAR